MKDEEIVQTPATGTDTGEDTHEENPAPAPETGGDDVKTGEEVAPEPTPPAVNYQEKFGASTRENQILSGQIARLQDQLGEVLKAEPPTEAELTAAYPEWATMTDVDRRNAKETLTLRKLVATLMLKVGQMGEAMSFSESFNALLDRKGKDGKLVYPGLRDRKDDFLAYCRMPSHKGAPLDVLAKAFLHELDIKPPVQKPKPPAKPEMQRGGGKGAGDTPTPGISDKEAEHIRKTDPKRYNELVRTGKIK